MVQHRNTIKDVTEVDTATAGVENDYEDKNSTVNNDYNYGSSDGNGSDDRYTGSNISDYNSDRNGSTGVPNGTKNTKP